MGEAAPPPPLCVCLQPPTPPTPLIRVVVEVDDEQEGDILTCLDYSNGFLG